MTKTKNTKSALISSVVALFLCFTMLIGSTFAWFTDSVTSANNIIQSGNLDIELEYWNGTEWKTVEGATDIITGDRWEPGYTEVAYLRLRNAGSLALNYQLGINIVSEKEGTNQAGETFKLSDYIEYGVIEGIDGQNAAYASREAAMEAVTDAKIISNGYTKSASLEADSAYTYLAMVVYMPTSVGNVANHNGESIPEIELGINIFATQFTSESDSFNNQYDEDAPHTLVTTADELVAAVAEGGYIMLKEDIALSDILVISKDGTVINGDGNKLTSTAGRAINVSGADGVIITDLTVECSGERAINVIQNSTDVTIDGCTLTANNYTVNVASSASNAVVTVKNSTLTGKNVVNVAAAGANVTVADSTVNCIDDAEEDYGALFLNKDATNGKITATNTTINISGSDMEGSSKGLVQAEGGVITIDGSTEDVIVEVAYIQFGNYHYGYRTLQEALETEHSDNQTIVLMRDVALNETITIPTGKTVAIDLNGYTISQSKACTEHYSMIENAGTLTVKDSVGTGKISFEDTGAGDPTFGWGSYTIYNKGNLTVESGTIENLCDLNPVSGKVHMHSAISQYSGSTTVTGGTISTPKYRSVRINGGSLNISGGNFEGQVWMQPFGNDTSLTISGGTFAPRNGDGSSVYITNDKTVAISITGGNFTTKIGMKSAVKCVTGGTFAADPSAYVAEGYTATESNGVWVVAAN